jgi:hypothetical protein
MNCLLVKESRRHLLSQSFFLWKYVVYSLRPDLFVASLGIMIVRDARIASDKKTRQRVYHYLGKKQKKI